MTQKLEKYKRYMNYFKNNSLKNKINIEKEFLVNVKDFTKHQFEIGTTRNGMSSKLYNQIQTMIN